ncbi:hypothetical protein [Streptomyces varsoviensis]|nr:hypothetical protein [Streptomyces varsoviensis]
MDAFQQHMLDAYRAARRGEAAPPAPGAGDLRAMREVRQWREFMAVVDERAAARRARRAALTRFLRPRAGAVADGRAPGRRARSGVGHRLLPSGLPRAGRRA